MHSFHIGDLVRATSALALLLFAQATLAGTYTGLVKPYYYFGNLYLDASQTTASDRPGCATRNLLMLAETAANDSTSQVFKNKFAILLSAWMAQRPVYLQGTGQCDGEGDEIIQVVAPG